MMIRTLHKNELEALLALYAHLHTDDDPLPAREVIESVWKEITSSPRMQCLGGFEGDLLVCSCTLIVVPNLTRGCRPYGLIENVVTHALHRGKGLGSKLLAYALAIAWEQQCYKVMLMTGRKDEATLRFYQKAGFDRHSKQAFVAKPAV